MRQGTRPARLRSGPRLTATQGLQSLQRISNRISSGPIAPSSTLSCLYNALSPPPPTATNALDLLQVQAQLQQLPVSRPSPGCCFRTPAGIAFYRALFRALSGSVLWAALAPQARNDWSGQAATSTMGYRLC